MIKQLKELQKFFPKETLHVRQKDDEILIEYGRNGRAEIHRGDIDFKALQEFLDCTDINYQDEPDECDTCDNVNIYNVTITIKGAKTQLYNKNEPVRDLR